MGLTEKPTLPFVTAYYQPTVHVNADGNVTTSLSPIPEETAADGAVSASRARSRKDGLATGYNKTDSPTSTPTKKKSSSSSLSRVFPGGGGGKTTISVTDIADSKAFDILLR